MILILDLTYYGFIVYIHLFFITKYHLKSNILSLLCTALFCVLRHHFLSQSLSHVKSESIVTAKWWRVKDTDSSGWLSERRGSSQNLEWEWNLPYISHIFWDFRFVGGIVVSDSDSENDVDDFAVFDTLVNDDYIGDERVM
jgi:hypothetical protein